MRHHWRLCSPPVLVHRRRLQRRRHPTQLLPHSHGCSAPLLAVAPPSNRPRAADGIAALAFEEPVEDLGARCAGSCMVLLAKDSGESLGYVGGALDSLVVRPARGN